jgi:transitional endoplasmic reticulum ATPase
MTSNIDDNHIDKNIHSSINKKDPKLATLKVAEAEQQYVERKIARVDPEVIERLNITSGDALELSSLGKKTTVLSWPAKDTDRGKQLIRIDEYIRNRLSVGLNDIVDVKKVDTKDANSITFAPTEPLRIVSGGCQK